MIKLLSFLAMTTLLSLTPKTGQQDKEYTAKLSVNEWQILIANQDDVSANSRRAVIQKVINQIQPQIQSDTIPKKK